MPARPKLARRRRVQPVAPDPWSGWIDVAVGIGHAVVAYELALAAVAFSPVGTVRRATNGRSRLTLVHSSDAALRPAPQHPRPVLYAVALRHEGKA